MKNMKKLSVFFILILIFVGLSVSYSRPPSWYMQTPTSRYYYYFSGSFTADTTTKAVNSAKAETIGSILFMINSTVSATQTFDKVYRRTSGRKDSQDSRLFKKIKTRGRAVVSRLQFVRKHIARARNGKISAYVLARIPKSEVEKSILKYKRMRQRLASLKTACIILVRYPNGEVKEASVLKNFIEKFYRETLGYNIVEADINLEDLKGLSIGRLTYKIKNLLPGYNQVILGLVELNERPTRRTNRVGGITMRTISVSGRFLLRTVELDTMKVVSNNDFSARGVSTRGANQAMEEMVNEFKKQLSGDNSSAGGRDAIFD